jgi:hypothetical protein
MKKIVMALALGILGAMGIGCGGGADCVSQCTKYNDCAGVTKIDDCQKSCDDNEAKAKKLNDATGCTSQYDAAATCSYATTDVCKADPACADEITAYTKCVTDACTKDPTKCM